MASMQSGSPAAGVSAAGSSLQALRAAAAVLGAAAAATAAESSASLAPGADVKVPAAPDADWEERLAAVNTTVGAAPSPRQQQPGSPPAGDAQCGGGGAPPLHQRELVEAVAGCPQNCVTFLPLGLGLRPVVDAVLRRAVAQSQGRHVLVVVDRPAHALSHAQRLRTELGLPTAVFCGGDFLYSFQQQFKSSRVLVFTAGLLLRLLKTGVYHLSQASLMVLMDAFTAVRNHPSNTLVREYWRTTEDGARPRVVAVLASQLPSKPRPFDRLRQHLRKLCHSLQAQLLLPQGAGLAQLEAQLHHDCLQLHSYRLAPAEERLASVLQQHLLGLWDVLHEFQLNHFGRLVQFAAAGGAAAAAAAAAAGSTPGTPAVPAATAGTPTSARLLRGSPLSARGSPVPEGSPATPQHGQGSGAVSAAAAAAEQPDPMQHDWAQVELQVVHSLWHSNALPARGEHMREPDALALMMHVLDCVRALRLLLELGPAACLERLPAALESLAAFLQEGVGGPPPFGGSVAPLKARILEVAAASPLLRWAQQAVQEPPAALAAPERPSTPRGGKQQEQEQQQQQQAGSEAQQPHTALPMPLSSTAEQRRRIEDDGPAAAAAAGRGSRAAALVQLLLELQVDAQLSGEADRRHVAVVSGSQESAASLARLLRGAEQLASAEVCLLREAPAPEDLASYSSSGSVALPSDANGLANGHHTGAANGHCNGHAAEAAAAAPDASDAKDAAVAGGSDSEDHALPASAEGSSAAATGVHVGAGLAVHLLAVDELAALERRIVHYHSLIWYSSGDVLHASSQELESGALSACHQLSAAAMAARGDDGGGGSAPPPDFSPRGGASRLSCHVLATASQVLALGEVRRVDHSLKAAMQLVRLGDAVAEERLTMLAHRSTAGVLESEAKAVLEMLCCGLVGSAPAFAVMMASPSKQARSRPASAASVDADAGADASEGDGGHQQQQEQQQEQQEQQEQQPAAPPVLFQTSVTLPAAFFPPERFHISGVSMPLEVFVGPQLPSEAAATNAASLLALTVLHRLGIVVRYWPSRLLLAQHLLPRSMDALSEPGGAGGLSSGAPSTLGGGGGGGTQPPMRAASVASGQPGAGGSGAGAPKSPMNYFCPLCNVAATGLKAFDAHMRGFRHQRRIKQAQLLQQGEEVSAMLQGLLLEGPPLDGPGGHASSGDGLPPGGSALPALAVRRPDLALEDDGDCSGSPAFSDRQAYSQDPTPYCCDTCGVYCTSERLLEAHTRGRKHQRRLAGLDSPGARAGSPKSQPLVTPYFCPTCGLYATSEEQLRMHMLGKRHTRMAALHRQRGTPLAGVAAGLSAAVGGAPWPDAGAGGVSLQQQHHQQLLAAAAAAAAAVSGGSGAAWVPSSSSGVRTSGTAASSAHDSASATTAGHGPSGSSTPAGGCGAPASSSSAGVGTWSEEAAAAALQGLLLDAAGNQRIYRCDLCGVVTPSRRHYDYHLQGIKHTRRLLRAQGLEPGSSSQPGTPASCASPLAGSRSASPCARGGRGRHSRHGSMDWAGGHGGAGGRGEEPAPETLICSVCGIMATSAVNLEDHYKGRRHLKNVERQQAQAAAAAAAASGQLPPGAPAPRAPFDSSTPFAGSGGSSSGGLQRSTSGITLGADGLRLSGGVLLSAGSLPRLPSGDVLEGFPCVRIGDVLLPSSMDLRAFLEEMQHLEGEEDSADLLPPISELHEHLPGLGGGGPSSGSHDTAAPRAPAPAQQPWAYGGSSTSGPASGSASPAAPAGTPPASWTSSSSGGQGGGGGKRLQPNAAPFVGGSSSHWRPAGTPNSSPNHERERGGGYGGRSRPGSGGGGGHRLSRFAHDQQAQQQAQQQQQQYQAESPCYATVQYGYTLQPAYGLVQVSPGYREYGASFDYGAQQGLAQMGFTAMPMSPVASYGTLTPVASYGKLAPMAQLSPSQAAAPPYYPSGSPVVLARVPGVPPPPSPSGRRRPPRQQQKEQQQQQQNQSPSLQH